VRIWLGVVASLAWAGTALAADEGTCDTAKHLVASEVLLPRVAAAISKQHILKVVVLGTGSSILPPPAGEAAAYPARLEAALMSRLPAVAVKVVPDVKLRKTAAELKAEEFERITVDENYVLRIPEGIPLDGAAPLLCAGITTYSPLRHWNVGKGHKLGVIGLGGLGHMALKWGASFGAEVTMLSTSPDKEADARRLGASKFALTRDPAQLKALEGYFDFLIDTVSAKHDYNSFLNLLATDGVMMCVGAPPTPAEVALFTLIGGRRSLAGSGIGGIPETQEMLDYCAKHDITSDIELIEMSYVNEAYERMLKSDVRYRFVIDMTKFN